MHGTIIDFYAERLKLITFVQLKIACQYCLRKWTLAFMQLSAPSVSRTCHPKRSMKTWWCHTPAQLLWQKWVNWDNTSWQLWQSGALPEFVSGNTEGGCPFLLHGEEVGCWMWQREPGKWPIIDHWPLTRQDPSHDLDRSRNNTRVHCYLPALWVPQLHGPDVAQHQLSMDNLTVFELYLKRFSPADCNHESLCSGAEVAVRKCMSSSARQAENPSYVVAALCSRCLVLYMLVPFLASSLAASTTFSCWICMQAWLIYESVK